MPNVTAIVILIAKNYELAVDFPNATSISGLGLVYTRAVRRDFFTSGSCLPIAIPKAQIVIKTLSFYLEIKNLISFFDGLSSGLFSNTLGELLTFDLIVIWNFAEIAYLSSLISIVLGSRLPVEPDPYSRVWAIA